MKKLSVFLVAVISLSVAFTSCKKDDPEQSKWDIDAKVENGANYNATVDSVYATLDNEKKLAGKAKYEDGGFKMNLMTVAPENLTTISEDIPDGVTVSDKTAKTAAIQVLYGVKNGNLAGLFLFTKYSLEDIMKEDFDFEKGGIALYLYADKDVKITGTDTETHTDDSQTYTFKTKYNLSLKKGWNRVVVNMLTANESNMEVELVNLTNPTGYKWLFIPISAQANMPRVNILKK